MVLWGKKSIILRKRLPKKNQSKTPQSPLQGKNVLMIDHRGQWTNLQSHDNAKPVWILLKVVLKLNWEIGGGQVGDEGVKASFLLKGSQYRSCLELLNWDNKGRTGEIFMHYKYFDVIIIIFFYHVPVLLWPFLKVYKCTFPALFQEIWNQQV